MIFPSVVFPGYNEVDNDLYDYLRLINAAELHLDHDYLDSEVDYMVMWINNQGQWNICPLNTTEDCPGY